MARYAIIRPDGGVENVIEWDGKETYEPPSGHMLIAADENAEPGGSWDGVRFHRPIPKPSSAVTLDEKLARLGLTRAELRAVMAGPP
jgi:hypothetical protein